jgi:hypothetical protein
MAEFLARFAHPTPIEFIAAAVFFYAVMVTVWAIRNDGEWTNRYVAQAIRRRDEPLPTWTTTTTTTIINKPRKRRHYRREVY